MYALRIAARPALNAATHASRVSRSVPSMSNRTARSRGTSGLLFAEAPDLVADVVDRLDRLALFLPGHRGSVHDCAADRERPAVLLVPDPNDIACANPGVRVDNPRGHHVRAVVDETYRAHVDRVGPFLRGEGEEPADRRSDSWFEEDRDRVVVPQQQAMGAGLRLVERHVVRRHLHTKFVGESAEEVRRLLAAKSRTPTNLHGHRFQHADGEDNSSFARRDIYRCETMKSARSRARGPQIESPREGRIEPQRLIDHLSCAVFLAQGPPRACGIAPDVRIRRIQPERGVERRHGLLRSMRAQY